MTEGFDVDQGNGEAPQVIPGGQDQNLNRREFIKWLGGGALGANMLLAGCATTRPLDKGSESNVIYESIHNNQYMRAMQAGLDKKVRDYPYKDKDTCMAFLDYNNYGGKNTLQKAVARGTEKVTKDKKGLSHAWFVRPSSNFKKIHRGKDTAFSLKENGDAKKLAFRDNSSFVEWINAFDRMGNGGKVDLWTFFYQHSAHWQDVVKHYNAFRGVYKKKTEAGYGVSPNTHVVEVLNDKQTFDYTPLKRPVSMAELIMSMQNRDVFRSSSPEKNKKLNDILFKEGDALIKALDIKILRHGANGKVQKVTPTGINDVARPGETIVWQDRVIYDFIHTYEKGMVIPKARVMTAMEMLLDGRFTAVELFRGARLWWSDNEHQEDKPENTVAFLDTTYERK